MGLACSKGSTGNDCATVAEHTYVLLGADGAGKTSLLQALGTGDAGATVPTVGFDKALVQHANRPLTLFDVGGGPSIRAIWDAYYADVHAAIFLVDAADVPLLDEVHGLLHAAASHECLQGKPLLVVANKQDLPHAAGPDEVAEALRLHDLPGDAKLHRVVGAAIRGKMGLPSEGLGWLASMVDADMEGLDARREREREAQQMADRKRKEERKARLAAKRAAKEAEEAEAAAAAEAAIAETAIITPELKSAGSSARVDGGKDAAVQEMAQITVARAEASDGAPIIGTEPTPPPATMDCDESTTFK